jgi:hypothetical protein
MQHPESVREAENRLGKGGFKYLRHWCVCVRDAADPLDASPDVQQLCARALQDGDAEVR